MTIKLSNILNFLLKDIESARLILILGYRSGVKVHSKEEFYKERT